MDSGSDEQENPKYFRHGKLKGQNWQKVTYSSWDSLLVTHATTNQPI